MSAGSLLTRHSGEGRNPGIESSPAKAGHKHFFIGGARYLLLLDSGLRRNDGSNRHLGLINIS